jgi:glycosyltransferase involved in cell wall biosynthesis
LEINGMQRDKAQAINTSVIILTYNSEATIKRTLERALLVTDDIHVVDSFSQDSTCDIVRTMGANLIFHEFENYGIQRRWASTHLPLKYDWELHLDADEWLSDKLAAEINLLQTEFPRGIDGYAMPRLTVFLGREIRHGGQFPIWHLRLFKRGKGRCEDREYDQHFIVDGVVRKLKGEFVDDMRMSLSEWTRRHNTWSDAEVRELSAGAGHHTDQVMLSGPLSRRRTMRKAYYYLPPLLRPAVLFFYKYFFRLGFLDGVPGLIFFVLQTFWFRFLVDAKLLEIQNNAERISTRRRRHL